MWKIKYVGLIVLCLIAPLMVPVQKPPFLGQASEYEVWTGANSSAARIVLCSAEYGAIDPLSVGGVSFESDMTADQVLSGLGATVAWIERTADVTSYYAVCDLPFAVCIEGKTVNVQVAVRKDGRVKVGSPIIFGSY